MPPWITAGPLEQANDTKELNRVQPPSPACGKLVDHPVHRPGMVRQRWGWWQAGSPPSVSTSLQRRLLDRLSTGFPPSSGGADGGPTFRRRTGWQSTTAKLDRRPECRLVPRWGRSRHQRGRSNLSGLTSWRHASLPGHAESSVPAGTAQHSAGNGCGLRRNAIL